MPTSRLAYSTPVVESLSAFAGKRENFFSDRGKFKTYQTIRAPRNLFLSARLDCKSTGDDQMYFTDTIA